MAKIKPTYVGDCTYEQPTPEQQQKRHHPYELYNQQPTGKATTNQHALGSNRYRLDRYKYKTHKHQTAGKQTDKQTDRRRQKQTH